MLNMIKERRSIRNYKPGRIDDAFIDKILEAAMYAPSARNLQSWQFLVIRKPALIESLTTHLPNGKMLPAAGTGILICADLSMEPNVGYAVVNCAAATQNALLSIHALGFGGVWLGVYPREERMDGIRQLFNLPSHIMPFSVIALGIAEEVPPVPERFKKDRIHYDEWGG